jgi:hypothetical protein
MLTRRNFMVELAAAGAATGALAMSPANIFAAIPPVRTAVVSIHMDQPYLDTTGRALPYVPPAGMRAAAPLAHLTEVELRRHFLYL